MTSANLDITPRQASLAEAASLSRKGGYVQAWKKNTVVQGIPLIAVLLLLWELLPRWGMVDAIFIPPLSDVARAWWDLLLTGELFTHIQASLARSAIGFCLAVAVAIPLGFLMGRYEGFERLTDLLVQSLRNTPQFALLPLFIILMGIGEASKIAITFYSAIWFILINTISGVKSVDPLLIKAARAMGASDAAIFSQVLLPASIPSIVSGARLGVKAAIVSVIGAEMLAAKSGLGYLVQHSQLMMEMPTMYAGIVTITAIGLATNYALVWFERRATSWKAASEVVTR
ncbi:Putative aliphatic sulfonates transport permease protein SsuC [Pigmentiphaga humi]|uniref:Aliphatic sulfonates transport permease protein SsuC n=1 Tax=Pigmentiphaga humi TaxID=2478468 RepID=A0A3P4B0V0_9BURK|nr:ABC transporter permease [Pigmentiphaga humi]VCU69360.1 Putative aliphatic sulfonates transport permease protein SsuC [Pigmentiphaga humi]